MKVLKKLCLHEVTQPPSPLHSEVKWLAPSIQVVKVCPTIGEVIS